MHIVIRYICLSKTVGFRCVPLFLQEIQILMTEYPLLFVDSIEYCWCFMFYKMSLKVTKSSTKLLYDEYKIIPKKFKTFFFLTLDIFQKCILRSKSLSISKLERSKISEGELECQGCSDT